MPIQYYKGDVLESDAGMIVHQVNTLGVMSGGIALQIKNKYPMSYHLYRSFIQSMGPKKLMGNIINVPIGDEQYITHLFGQDAIDGAERNTDYDALRTGLIRVKRYALENDLTVAIPKYIGCGLAGGEWSIVEGIIFELFLDSKVKLSIYEFTP